MDGATFMLVEGLLVLGGVLAFGIWQLRATARDQAATRAREREEGGE